MNNLQRLLDVYSIDDLAWFTGEVVYEVDEVAFFGYLNADDKFVELFADSINGRSHNRCGRVHDVPLEQLKVTWLVCGLNE